MPVAPTPDRHASLRFSRLRGLLPALLVLTAMVGVLLALPQSRGIQRATPQSAPTPGHLPSGADIARSLTEPNAYKPLTEHDALAENAARPLDRRRLETAPPFVLSETGAEWNTALDCLSLANYYEAASEGPAGMRAVSQVVLNRLRHPVFPQSVCAVVFQGSDRPTGCQFTFTCDGSMNRPPVPGLFARARAIASEALRGRVEGAVGMATHYHADFVVPYWADSLDKVRTVGRHIFYTWHGAMGNRAAFRAFYAGEQEFRPSPHLPALATVTRPDEADEPPALAKIADRITLSAQMPDSRGPQRVYLVADEPAQALMADDEGQGGSLRPQPALVRKPERMLNDDR